MLHSDKRKAMEKAPSSTPQVSRGLTPFDELDRYFAELEQNMLNRGWLQPFWPSHSVSAMPFEGRTPRVDVVDCDDHILVKAELPGVDKNDLDVDVSENTITFKAESSREEKEEAGDYYRHEIACGSFSRSITLPTAINADKAKAKFKDGVLELTLPKTEKPSRKKIKVE